MGGPVPKPDHEWLGEPVGSSEAAAARARLACKRIRLIRPGKPTPFGTAHTGDWIDGVKGALEGVGVKVTEDGLRYSDGVGIASLLRVAEIAEGLIESDARLRSLPSLAQRDLAELLEKLAGVLERARVTVSDREMP